MPSLLHPVGDGASVGDIAIVGSNGVERFVALTPLVGDSYSISIEAHQSNGFDVQMQSRSPIALGDGVMRGRFARVAGDGGIELAVSLWREDPHKALDANSLIAYTNNFTVWHDDWQEFSIQLLGRQCDGVAAYMGNLWIRVLVASAIDGTGVPTLGVSALWLEVPDPADSVVFNDVVANPPPPETLVTIRTFTGRSGVAKQVAGEWKDASGQPFEADSSSLPIGSDGLRQPSRAVDGWG
jgi:hypothetical protein